MTQISRRQFVQTGALGLIASRLPFSFDFERLRSRIQADPVLERRKEYLALLQRLVGPSARNERPGLNAHGDKTWDEWQTRTGELPPDFATMIRRPLLPDPMRMLDTGAPIRNGQQWERQRELIRAGFDEWILGKMPPAPDNLRGTVVETRQEGDATVQQVRLEFGPDHKATLRLQLQIPPGDGPFPLFLTNHQRARPWVNTAIRRGYASCIYHAIDRGYGIGDDSEAWMSLYPEYDFAAIARWAWGAMRAVDYLVQQPFIDRRRIAIGGHSRNAKQALLAAAYDTRIGAVVGSRGNSGEALPWRFTDDIYVQEAIQEITGGLPTWFHPRLRFFVGREHLLPVDQNLLLSLVAPRGLLISHAYQEHQGNSLGIEQAFRSVQRVYRWMGKPDHIGLYQQPGEHHSSVEDVDRYFDFFDNHFGRKKFPVPVMFVHGYSFEEWKAKSREQIDPRKHPVRVGLPPVDALDDSGVAALRSDIQSRIAWTLGDEPPVLPLAFGAGSGNRRQEEGWRGLVFNRPGVGYDATEFPYGDDLVGYLYRPPRLPPRPDTTAAGRGGSARTDSGAAPGGRGRQGAAPTQGPRPTNSPVVIWLHPYSYATGFSRYVYWGPLYQRGFEVIAFDQIGFGSRADYPVRFYDRHPRWSLLGKMVADTRAVVDAVVRGGGNRFDRSRIFLQGYGLGAKVALITAALDDRIAGVTASTGIAPLRSEVTKRETEGIRHYSHIHGLAPRLGFFEGHESRVPVDYDEIIAAIAPRPVHIAAPLFDRHAPVEEVQRTVEEARRLYARLGKTDALTIETPEDFNRFPAVWMRQVDWVTRQAGLTVPPPRTRQPGQ